MVALLEACSANPAGVRFDPTVPADQKALIQQDLSRLGSIQLPPPNPSDLQLMDIPDFSGASFTQWLGTRLKYVVGEGYDYNANSSTVQTPNGAGPQILSSTDAARLRADGANAAQTVMFNLGSYLYLDGKQNGYEYLLNLAGNILPILSPRVDVVQIGEALFTLNSIPGVPIDSPANSALRFCTYIHEGHHGDGNGANAGLPHAQCPSGTYSGLYACDSYRNGPYAIQAMVLGYYYNSCQSCSQTELAGLSLQLADLQSRLLPNATMVDDRPEAIPGPPVALTPKGRVTK